MKHLSLALVFTIMLLSESAKAATDDGNLCALRLPATKAVGKPRALEFVSAYIGDPIVIQKPEYYRLPGNRFRMEWLVNHDPDFFFECRYTGGETIHAHVSSAARMCEMRAHELGPAKYRPYSIICR
jgi:hypothetical protein